MGLWNPTVDGQTIQTLQHRLCWIHARPNLNVSECVLTTVMLWAWFSRPLGLIHFRLHEHWTLGARGRWQQYTAIERKLPSPNSRLYESFDKGVYIHLGYVQGKIATYFIHRWTHQHRHTPRWNDMVKQCQTHLLKTNTPFTNSNASKYDVNGKIPCSTTK